MAHPRPIHRRTLLSAFSAAALTLAVTACGNDGESGPKGDPADALDTPTTLTFWTWAPNVDKVVARFEKKYPKIKVKVVNAGQSAAQYTKLQTAIKAGTGAPDVAQVEYFALPEFALTKRLVNLKDYGAAELEPKFAASAWSQVSISGGIYGIPQDTGPMAMFYNAEVLRKFGIEPPRTWAEFEAAADKLHRADPDRYITSIDPGDAGFLDSLLWQAGSRPFRQTSDSSVSVDLADNGAQKVAEFWTRLLNKNLVDTAPGWTNEWWQAMSSGKYAMWIIGAWAPGNLASTIPNTAGQWRAAPIPQWNAGDSVSAENGGSANVVTATSKHKEAAVAFATWLNAEAEGTRALSEAGLFPATTALLTDPDFLDTPIEVLGGQKANQVLAQSSEAVKTGWQFLPYQVYANSVFKDTVGQSIGARKPLASGLQAWQERITEFGEQQGFSVSAS
ncbi:sugar ABC transporter substrate-binding protein [Wenjunlia vitaminophila]|uniref:Sugar ABC transporter substrate-binding protein n=1 Tax=Wenjunlia vitaminophila TaxID=76728 RepID=A0A0T6LPJ5_WENVI|nr:sugar ABC transporter substrate-binding protein [Wenjunlia vitaminophila]KRV47997.1 sugar ABC transporter substrate-binding protein [Wenjunlia vitaminophila]